jgi:hypothetical protein
MTAILIFGAAVGAILGRCDFKVFALVPVMLLVAADAVAIGVATGLDLRTITFGLLEAVVSPQIGYLVGSVGVDYMVAEYLRVRATNQRPVLLRAMRSMIGQELRAAFELPKAMPRELVVLLAQMNKR